MYKKREPGVTSVVGGAPGRRTRARRNPGKSRSLSPTERVERMKKVILPGRPPIDGEEETIILC